MGYFFFFSNFIDFLYITLYIFLSCKFEMLFPQCVTGLWTSLIVCLFFFVPNSSCWVFFKFIFIFGCVGSLLLRAGFL